MTNCFERQRTSSSSEFFSRLLQITGCLLLLIFSPLVYADCDRISDGLSKTLNYRSGETSGRQTFIDCKSWPQDPTIYIVAMARFQENSAVALSTDNDAGFYDLTVLLLKNESDQVLTRLFQKGAFSSDAIRLTGIAIDAAPYKLASGQRAFGVRARFSNSSVVSSWEHEQLNLYLVQNVTLHQILGRLVIAKKLYEKVGDCQESVTDLSRKLIVATSSKYGKADLTLKEQLISDKSNVINNKCTWRKKVFLKNHTLHFDGHNYLVPEELQ